MKVNINKQGDCITFIPETELDCFHLGRISMKTGCFYETTSNTDVREEKLRIFKMGVGNIIRLMQK